MPTSEAHHLDVLIQRLGRECSRLAEAGTDKERTFRQVQVDACKREIAEERHFLGLRDEPMTDAELLAALGV